MKATFKSMEHAGWTEKAPAYDQHFASITRQAIDPILDCAGNLKQRDVLDICCGTGDLTAEAINRGAKVTGVDFASTMIEIARQKVPQAKFEVGDAEALSFPNEQFDVALCSFGLWHMAEPDKALGEAARVLRKGGLYVYTTWLPPQEGWDMFDLLVRAIKAHGTMDVNLPPAPPPFRFASASEAERALKSQGFAHITCKKLRAQWTGTTGEQLLDLIYKAVVRAPMLIDAQTHKARDSIVHEIKVGAEAMRQHGYISMRWPYLLVSARLD
jgi:SAM-dependent methyltransferase